MYYDGNELLVYEWAKKNLMPLEDLLKSKDIKEEFKIVDKLLILLNKIDNACNASVEKQKLSKIDETTHRFQ